MAANKNKYASESAAAIVHHDILLEILIRLPRMGPAITVCKSWHSLIISDHHYAFLRHTLHHHYRRQSGDPDPSYTAPWTLLIGYRPTDPWVQVLSEKLKILEAALSRQSPQKSLLGFVSNLNSEAIKASFNDSLLIHLNGHYSIYNTRTREQRLLPNPPSANTMGDLMLVGKEDPNGIFRFRVLKFPFGGPARPNTVVVFSSETGQWKESVLNLNTPHAWNWAVAVDGALYWRHGYSGIALYDPFCQANDRSSCRIVEYPLELPAEFGILNFNRSVWIGAVRGRLRLLETLKEEKDISFRIWELKIGKDDDEWSLVRQVRMEKGIDSMFIRVLAFHPEDGDVIFVLSGDSVIYRCELKGKRFTKVGQVSTAFRITDAYFHPFRNHSLVHHWC